LRPGIEWPKTWNSGSPRMSGSNKAAGLRTPARGDFSFPDARSRKDDAG
jgi:hypothetical protein